MAESFLIAQSTGGLATDALHQLVADAREAGFTIGHTGPLEASDPEGWRMDVQVADRRPGVVQEVIRFAPWLRSWCRGNGRAAPKLIALYDENGDLLTAVGVPEAGEE